MGKERMALHRLDDRRDAVMPADPQVVALSDVVGEDDLGVLPDAGQHGQQDVALQRLGLVDDHERIVQRPAPDVGQREHFEHPAVEDLLDDLGRHERAEGVEHRLAPGAHLLGLGAGQVPELLAADRIQRPEDDDLAVLAAFHDRFEAGAERKRRLPRARPAAETDDADVGVEEQVERDPLLSGPAMQAERVAVAADESDLLVGADPAEPAAARREQHETGVARELRGRRVLDPADLVQPGHLLDGHVQLGHAGPAGVDGQLGAVLLGVEPDRGRLDPHRQVLADDRDVEALRREVLRHREDSSVVVPQPEPRRQDDRVGVVQLDPQRPTIDAYRHRTVEATLLDPQVVEHAQRLTREVPELGVVPLALQLRDDDDGQDHLVLLEPEHRLGVGEEHRGVENEGLAADGRGGTTGGGSGGGHVRLLAARW
jgi:hypothetical protein